MRITGVRETFVDITFTALSNKARRAVTTVASDLVNTLAIIETFWSPGKGVNEWGAVIHVDLTVHSLSPPGTRALVCIDQIDASATILARVGQTLVDLLRAVHPMVASDTLT